MTEERKKEIQELLASIPHGEWPFATGKRLKVLEAAKELLSENQRQESLLRHCALHCDRAGIVTEWPQHSPHPGHHLEISGRVAWMTDWLNHFRERAEDAEAVLEFAERAFYRQGDEGETPKVIYPSRSQAEGFLYTLLGYCLKKHTPERK
jgi:hypothetical protein